MKRIITILIIITGILLSFSICSIKLATSQANQEVHYIVYKSDFFSLYFNNETYYGNEHYNFFLNIEITKNNNIENFSLELQLFNLRDNKVDLIIHRNYFYNELERTLYNNSIKIGILPIFIEENYQNNQDVLLAEFNNKTLIGTYQKKEGGFVISDKSYSFDTVLTDEVNYTEYYYSDIGNMLIFWRIGNTYEITLHKLFNITYFYGHIGLESTNFDLKPEHILKPILPVVIIIVIFIVAFISVFILVRRSLIRNDKYNKPKKRYKRYK